MKRMFVSFIFVTDNLVLSGTKLGMVEGTTKKELVVSAVKLWLKEFEVDADKIRANPGYENYSPFDELDFTIERLESLDEDKLVHADNKFGWWLFLNELGSLILSETDYIDLNRYNTEVFNNMNTVEELKSGYFM